MTKTKDELAKEYGTEVITTAFTPNSLDEYFRTTTRWGLIWDYGWLYAELAAASGQRYALLRGYEKMSTSHVLTSKLANSIDVISPKLYKHLYMGATHFDRVKEEGKELIRIASYPSKNNFKIEIEINKIHWQEENGEIDLKFEALGPACRWFCPGAKIPEDLYYTSELFQVTGTIQNEKVNGYGGLDQSWHPPGIGWNQAKIYSFIQDYWFWWVNRYADGSHEYGIIQSGAGDWKLSFLVENGKSFITDDNEFQMTWVEKEYLVPAKAEFRLGPKHFKWECDRRVAEIKGFVLWATGHMINLGRKDAPVESFSWIEFRAR